MLDMYSIESLDISVTAPSSFVGLRELPPGLFDLQWTEVCRLS